MKINIKMERDTITIKLDSERDYKAQRDEVKAYLLKMKSFLAKGEVKVGYDGIDLTFEEEMDLCSIADEAFEEQVDFCYRQSPPKELMRHITNSGEHLVRKVDRTVRAGEMITSNGDIVVIGDVNPTAQLVAYGDVYVIGNLRGIAHAGCKGNEQSIYNALLVALAASMGNEQSIIYAAKMNPVMLKIADKIGFNTDLSKKNSQGIAKLENGEIQVNML